KVTGPAAPFDVLSRQRYRVVKGRQNSGALCPFASMVTGDATTAVVTHAWRVGSRLEECLEFFPRARYLRACALREYIAMAGAARRPGARQHPKRRSSRRRSAPFEQMNLNAAGIDVGATEHWVAVPEDRDEEPVRRF